jgi:hypothetical protein
MAELMYNDGGAEDKNEGEQADQKTHLLSLSTVKLTVTRFRSANL